MANFRKFQKKPKKTIAKRRGRKMTLVKMIKNIAISQQETKKSMDYFASVDLYHNTTTYKGALLSTTQGVTGPDGFSQSINNRIGDRIHAKGIYFRLQWITPPLRPNLNVAFYVFKYPSNMTSIVDANFWRGVDGAGGAMNRLLDAPNTELITVVKKIFVQNNRGANSNTTENSVNEQRVSNIYRNCYVKIDKTVVYDCGGSIPKTYDYAIACVAYDANNTLTSDIVGFLSYTYELSYKDA